jgi:hypothetical protein
MATATASLRIVIRQLPSANPRGPLGKTTTLVDREKAAREMYARLLEPIRYLFLAHGAALAVSISALKDLKDASIVKHVGQVAGWFAIGFAVAVIGYIIIVLHKERTLGSYTVEIKIPRSEITHVRILIAGLMCVFVSAFILVFDTILVACKVWSL